MLELLQVAVGAATMLDGIDCIAGGPSWNRYIPDLRASWIIALDGMVLGYASELANPRPIPAIKFSPASIVAKRVMR